MPRSTKRRYRCNRCGRERPSDKLVRSSTGDRYCTFSDWKTCAREARKLREQETDGQ